MKAERDLELWMKKKTIIEDQNIRKYIFVFVAILLTVLTTPSHKVIKKKSLHVIIVT